MGRIMHPDVDRDRELSAIRQSSAASEYLYNSTSQGIPVPVFPRMNTVHSYTYVGPEKIRLSVKSHPVSTPLSSRQVLEDWLQARPEARE